MLPFEFKQEDELQRIGVLEPQGLSSVNSYNIKSISSLGSTGFIVKVKLPFVDALKMYHAEFCSFGPNTSIQVPASGSESFIPGPFRLVTV